ncbi:hypothetical protein HY251_22080, partial [bacterium]|nr:hypothetical protein [bacterium]
RSARAAAPARRRFVLAAAVLALAVAGTLAIIARLGQESPPFGMLGKSACHSHDGYLAGSEPPDVVSTAPAEISSYVASKVGVTMRSPDLALLAPTGARCCAWGKTHVCFLMGRQGVEPVSAFVFPSSDLRFFPEARAALDSGSGRAYAEFKGRQVLLERNDRVTACVVASREAGSLEPVASALLGAP